MLVQKRELLLILALATSNTLAAFESLACSNSDPYFANVGGYDQYNIAKYAKDLESQGTCSVPAGVGQCVRVSCGNTSGIWMCNDTDQPQSVPCSAVANYVNDDSDELGLPNYENDQTIMACPCSQYSCGGTGAHGASGQIHDSQGFSVIAAYANCNVDPSLDPQHQ